MTIKPDSSLPEQQPTSTGAARAPSASDARQARTTLARRGPQLPRPPARRRHGLAARDLGLVVLFIVFTIAHDRFLTTYNMANLVVQAASICVLAMGIVFVLLLGEIDLSAGVAGGASATITALAIVDNGWTWWLAVLAGIAVGAVIGLAIGALVALLGIPSFVVTLAFFLALQAVPLKLIGPADRSGSTTRCCAACRSRTCRSPRAGSRRS